MTAQIIEFTGADRALRRRRARGAAAIARVVNVVVSSIIEHEPDLSFLLDQRSAATIGQLVAEPALSMRPDLFDKITEVA